MNRMPPWQIEDLCKVLLEDGSPMPATAVYLIRELASRIVQLEEEHAEFRDYMEDKVELLHDLERLSRPASLGGEAAVVDSADAAAEPPSDTSP